MRVNKAFLDKCRLIGDLQADAWVENLFRKNLQSELYAAFQLPEKEIRNLNNSNPVKSFLLTNRIQPEWFDETRLLRGQQVFKMYAAEIMMLLGVMALPYCYAASPGNKALYLSDKMRQSPGKRLLDTAHFIISISTPGTLAPDQYGHVHINKTRLIHAMARHYVRKGNWDMTWGLPINQEDMAGTNLAFSLVILMGLQQAGYVLSENEKEDFIFLWRYVGYQLGMDENLLATSFKEAYHLTNIIKKRNFRKTTEGISLTKELLSYYRSVAPSNQAPLIDAQVRHFLGPEVSGYVGLEPEYVKDQVTNFINSFSEWQHVVVPHTSSYNNMMENHRLLTMNINRQIHPKEMKKVKK